MDENINILLKYTKASLHNKKCSEEIIDEKAFYLGLVENGLIGIVFPLINKTQVSNKLYNKLQNDFFGYVKKDIKQKSLILKIKTIFNKEKINHIFLKGSHLKDLYKESYMRGMGDIDILIKKEDLSKVHNVFNNNEFKLISRSLAHDVFESIDNLFVEIHPGFNVVTKEKFTKILDNPFDYANIKNNYELVFNPSYEVVYLTYHLAKHLYSGGIGLRSVLDIAIYLNYYKDNIDEKLLDELLIENNLKTFFSYLVKLNNKLFDYNIEFEILKDVITDDETLNDLAKHIAKAGIHGTGSNHNEFTSRIISSNKKASKFRFLLTRLFPTFKEMKGIYPVLNKWWTLLPIFYIVRAFKLVFLSGKTNLQKVKAVKNIKEVSKTDELFKDIGL